MRERRTLSPEEMEALLAHAGGVPPDPSSSAGMATPAQPDGALLQEFTHFLLTGALQAQWGAGRVRRLDVEPAPGVPLPGDAAYGGQRAVRLEGDLAGVLVLGVRALPGAGEAPGAGERAAHALALALAADLPARMGRLLGVALAARSAVKPADLEEEPGATPREEWFGFLGRVDGGDHGSWELYIGF